jgi:VIT1/CCC1 family predicted Fe2+/Mn2+ transporter
MRPLTRVVTSARGRHDRLSGNALRAGVLGATDGLVSNLSLVMGVAGAAFSNTAILVSGLAGLLAGAGSMALGEWISVQSSKEVTLARLALDPRAAAPRAEGEDTGANPANRVDSAWTAAWASFLLFAMGAMVPVVPFAFLGGKAAVLTSVSLSAGALFALGAGISILTRRGAARSGTRQLLLGMAAAALTFGVGRLLGVAVS